MPPEIENDGDYIGVRHRWHLTPSSAPDALIFNRRSVEGHLVPADWSDFGEGDFVDVVATIDVAVIRSKGWAIHLRPRSITLLAQAGQESKPSISAEAASVS